MTNKDYIKWLKLLDEELPFDGLVDGKAEMDMHEMIFELCEKLEQEPCEDCISRHAAKRIIFDEFEGWPTDEEVARLKRLTRQFDNLPSVTPKEPKTGHWIFEIWNNREHHFCSECNRVVDYEPCYYYCPYCGVKMESEK